MGEKMFKSRSAQPSRTGAQKLPPTQNAASGTSFDASRTASLDRSNAAI